MVIVTSCGDMVIVTDRDGDNNNSYGECVCCGDGVVVIKAKAMVEAW